MVRFTPGAVCSRLLNGDSGEWPKSGVTGSSENIWQTESAPAATDTRQGSTAKIAPMARGSAATDVRQGVVPAMIPSSKAASPINLQQGVVPAMTPSSKAASPINLQQGIGPAMTPSSKAHPPTNPPTNLQLQQGNTLATTAKSGSTTSLLQGQPLATTGKAASSTSLQQGHPLATTGKAASTTLLKPGVLRPKGKSVSTLKLQKGGYTIAPSTSVASAVRLLQGGSFEKYMARSGMKLKRESSRSRSPVRSILAGIEAHGKGEVARNADEHLIDKFLVPDKEQQDKEEKKEEVPQAKEEQKEQNDKEQQGKEEQKDQERQGKDEQKEKEEQKKNEEQWLSRPAPGELLHRLLLSEVSDDVGSDSDEEEMPLIDSTPNGSAVESASSTSKGCAVEEDVAPIPKKMPRPKVLMALVPKAPSMPPPAALQAPPKMPPPPPMPQIPHVSWKRKRPAATPQQESWSRDSRWKQQQAEAQAFYAKVAGKTEFGGRCLQVLACHCARLGPVAAQGLEEAVRRAVEAAGPNADNKVERWNFLQTPHGKQAFAAVKTSIETAYRSKGRIPQTDNEVRWQLGIGSCSKELGKEVSEIPMGERAPAPPSKPKIDELHKGELMLLPISEVRFAHNNQSEHFVNCAKDCSILQLAVELVAGVTPLEAVPTFTVCWHAGQWYCRSGNRRMAAMLLASIFAPRRFHCVWVRVVATDSVFLQGGSITKRPKLTTHLNGGECQGQWLIIKETGEVVGHAKVLDTPPYGSDLLTLLPQSKAGVETVADAGSNAGAPMQKQWF